MSVLAPHYHALRVRAVIDETADARSLEFEVPEPLRETFRYKPGQFLTLRLPLDGRRVPRCYSMSSAPALDTAPRVTIKRVAGGLGSNWVCDNVKPGDVIDVLAPSGVFTPRSLDGPFLLFAGGSGITPIYSILRSALAAGSARVLLVYANRDRDAAIFRRELEALAAEHASRFSLVHWLDCERGVPDADSLGALAQPWRYGEAFICGPAPFMSTAVSALEGLGFEPERVHVERFASLPDEADATAPDDKALPDAGEAATLEIGLDGATHSVSVAPGETLLEAAVRAGLQPPFSCQAGVCASCMCQVIEGTVHLKHNEVLDSNDLARGWTLSCQAVAASPRVRIRYPE